jgi:Domain of unknown function (DUF4416)
MAQAHTPDKECLIVGLLSAWPELFDRVAERMSECFGPLMAESDLIPFTNSSYYEADMGPDLMRKFIAFDRPIAPDALAEIKEWTNELEAKLAADAHPVARPVNIDPGLLYLSRLVLATVKNRAHRIYLGRGIYGEITLIRQANQWQKLQWTYTDYQSEPYHAFFNRVRDKLLARAEVVRRELIARAEVARNEARRV